MLSGRKIPSDGGNAAAISRENKPAILSIINNIMLRKRLELNSSKPEITLPGSELTAQCLFKIIPLLEKPISCLSIPLSNLALFLQDLSMIQNLAGSLPKLRSLLKNNYKFKPVILRY